MVPSLYFYCRYFCPPLSIPRLTKEERKQLKEEERKERERKKQDELREKERKKKEEIQTKNKIKGLKAHKVCTHNSAMEGAMKLKFAPFCSS